MKPSTSPVVVITGASSGIGRSTAHAFARRGARLMLAARSRISLEAAAQECRRLGAEADWQATDVGDEPSVEALAQAATARFGRIDVWVGAASVYSVGRFDDTPSDVVRQVLETNLHGQVHGARAALARFRQQGAGVLVMVGSVYSRVSAPYLAPYVASKWGTLGLAHALRQELRGSGIRVCAVLPATVDTPLYQHQAVYADRRQEPLPPIVDPRRVARVIVRLARRPRPVRIVGRVQGLAVPFRALAPRAYDAAIAFAMTAIGLRGEPATPDPGTVFEPDPASDAVSGGWRARRPRLLATTVLAGALAATRVWALRTPGRRR